MKEAKDLFSKQAGNYAGCRVEHFLCQIEHRNGSQSRTHNANGQHGPLGIIENPVERVGNDDINDVTGELRCAVQHIIVNHTESHVD